MKLSAGSQAACLLAFFLAVGPTVDPFGHPPKTEAENSRNPRGVIREYALPTPDSAVFELAVDPQDRIWYAGVNANLIGRFDPQTETFAEFPVPTPAVGPRGLVSDEQGRIWFTENRNGRIDRLAPESDKFYFFYIPSAKDPLTIILGASGRFWFTSPNSNRVVRFTPKTFGMKEYRLSSPEARPYGIVAGPDGRIWFCEAGDAKLAVLDPQTGAITEYSTPTENSEPRRLAAGENFIWLTEFNAGKLARFNFRTQEWQEWPSPAGPDSQPFGIAVAQDGSVWYQEVTANRMVRFDPVTETFETFPLPSPGSIVRRIVRDSRGTLWMAISGNGNNQIARID